MKPILVALPLEKKVKKVNFLTASPDAVGGNDFDRQHADASRICRYAQEVHGIKLPDGFPWTLVDSHRNFFFSSSFYMDTSHVDAIVTACEIWKNFIDTQQFDDLVSQELESFARLHTSVIQAPKIESVQEIRVISPPDYRFATIVGKHGGLVTSM